MASIRKRVAGKFDRHADAKAWSAVEEAAIAKREWISPERSKVAPKTVTVAYFVISAS